MVAYGSCLGDVAQSQNAGRPIRAAAHRRFRMSRAEGHSPVVAGLECDGRHVGGGDTDHVGHSDGWFDAGVDCIEAAVIGVLASPN